MNRSSAQQVLAAGIGLGLFVGATQAQGPRWLPGFERRGFNDSLSDLQAFDKDGTGPGPNELYASGQFTSADGHSAKGIARWNGETWIALAHTTNSNQIDTIEVFDEDGDGPEEPALFVFGSFTQIDGVPANTAARWDGNTWSPLGTGLQDGYVPIVFATAVFDEDGPGPRAPELFVAGIFAHAGGEPASCIAKWDGSAWHPVGTGIAGGAVSALAVFDEDGDGPGAPALYAAGRFTSAGGIDAPNIARWDGAAWSAVGGGIPDYNGVNCLQAYDPDGNGPVPGALYAGGYFLKAGGQSAKYIAKWDGSAWSPVGSGADSYVFSMAVADIHGDGPPLLCVGGQFEQMGGFTAQHIATWDGADWAPVGQGIGIAPRAIEAFDPDGDGPEVATVFVGGQYCLCPDDDLGYIAHWTGGGWRGLGRGLGNDVYDMTVASLTEQAPPVLYVAGNFTRAAGEPINRIAAWDGESWSPLGEGIDGFVWCLATYTEQNGKRNLFAGGTFAFAGGVAARSLARWDGQNWSVVGTPLGPEYIDVGALAVFDDDANGPRPAALYVGGHFGTADDMPASNIARWNGQSWSGLGDGIGPPSGRVIALAVFDDDGLGPGKPVLFAGGDFQTAGGQKVRYLARWNGQEWSPVIDAAGGVQGPVRALVVWDPDGDGPESKSLYVGGRFDTAGAAHSDNIARWDGSAWRPVGSGLRSLYGYGGVSALCEFDDDGAGPATPALYAGGLFGYMPDENVAKWDGTTWTPLPGGTDGGVHALATFDDDADGPLPERLFVSGSFWLAGALSSSNIARWGRLADTCPADCDHSLSLDLLDFLCFSALFESADPAADCDASGSLDLFDFLCFINSFNGGCP